MKVDSASISAYLDGEVEEPFRSSIAAIIEDDAAAASTAAMIQRLRRALPRTPSTIVEVSAARSWEALQAAALRRPSRQRIRRVALPLPALIGTAAALVMMIGLTISALLPERPTAGDYLANADGVDVTIRVDGNDMEQVLQWLVDKNMLGEVDIQLPEQQFEIVGEPVLLKPDLITGGIQE